MKISVLGGAGYIGSVTTEKLLDQGHDVVVIDNLERGYREAVDPRARFQACDLRHRDQITTLLCEEKPDAAIHFAAYIEVGESMKQPIPFFENNIIGSLHLMDALVQAQCKKLIFSSTCAIYGTPEQLPMHEQLPFHPESVYGESKHICEKMFSWIAQLEEIDTVFLRYFNAAGASERYGEAHTPETHLIPLILQVAQGKREHISIFGDDYPTRDGTCIRDYIHVADLADAHIAALRPGVQGAYNLGNGNGYTVKEVIEACRTITGHPIPTQIEPRRAGDCVSLIADATHAHQALDWHPQYDLHEIVKSAWAWHQAHPDGY